MCVYIGERDTNIFIYEERMPYTVRAVVMPGKTGYTVYVNEHLSDEAKEKAINHELEHIRRSDPHSERPATEIEQEMKRG